MHLKQMFARCRTLMSDLVDDSFTTTELEALTIVAAALRVGPVDSSEAGHQKCSPVFKFASELD